MGFIALFLLLLALFEFPSIVPTGHALDLSNAITKTSTFTAVTHGTDALLPSIGLEKRGKKPRKKHKICKRNPKSCKRFSKHHSCCYHHICVNLSRNPFHCGSCGHVCEHGMKCCKGVCVDVRMDRNHCGKCQNVCISGETCLFSMCGYG